MHWLDIAALLILAFCATVGFIRGGVVEIVNVLALGIAVALALVIVDAMFPPDAVTDSASTGLSGENVVKLVVYLGGLCAAYYVPKRLLSGTFHTISIMRVGARSRLIGSAVGLLKGTSVLVTVYLLVELAVPPSDWPKQWGQEAVSTWVIYHLVSGLGGGLPESMRPNILPPPTGEDSAVLYSRPSNGRTN